MKHSKDVAYIIGVALGDGNLSCPNGRATRLRVTCDVSNPKVAEEIEEALRNIFPKNKISRQLASKDTYFDISVYSNKLNQIMPWKVGQGTKFEQDAHVPSWIMKNIEFSKSCLRGLIQTDGSIYTDRGYLMINFTNNVKRLADDTLKLMLLLGYKPNLYKAKNPSGSIKYTVRLSKEVASFVKEIKLYKD